MHQENQQLIQTLIDCANECNHCYHACLQEQDVKMMARCIMLDRDCADICMMTAKMLASGSELSAQMLRLCAEACDACGAECAKHEHEHCQRCAESCKKCADACRSGK
ncbi:MAG: four-helix bundle copper-binding protein [Bacteroidia bacterium]